MSKKIGALWQKKDKNNQTYLAGDTRKQEQKSNAPDWNILLNEPRQDKEKVKETSVEL